MPPPECEEEQANHNTALLVLGQKALALSNANTAQAAAQAEYDDALAVANWTAAALEACRGGGQALAEGATAGPDHAEASAARRRR